MSGLRKGATLAAALVASSSAWAEAWADVYAVVDPKGPDECLLRVHSGDHLVYNDRLALQIAKMLGRDQHLLCMDVGAHDIYLDGGGK